MPNKESNTESSPDLVDKMGFNKAKYASFKNNSSSLMFTKPPHANLTPNLLQSTTQMRQLNTPNKTKIPNNEIESSKSLNSNQILIESTYRTCPFHQVKSEWYAVVTYNCSQLFYMKNNDIFIN